MGLIAYSCPYIPAELIAACGLTACRILPASAGLDGPVDVTAGVCPYMRGFVNTASAVEDVSAIILTTVCGQMRHAKDYIEQRTSIPSFMLNVPSTWQTPEAVSLYISELRRLMCFMEHLGGNMPDRQAIWQAIEEYDVKRRKLRALRASLTARSYSMAIAEFGRTGRVEAECINKGKDGGIPVAFLGGPLTRNDFDLFDIVRNAGGNVVLDGTETGERTMPLQYNRRHSPDDNPLEELAACYFGHIPDVFRRPNSELYKWLGHEIESRGIMGVILIRHLWCDKWHAEVARLKEWLKIAVLDIDLNGESVTARNTCRIQAFMEAFS